MRLSKDEEVDFITYEHLGLAQEISREDYIRWQELHKKRMTCMYIVHQQLPGNKIEVYVTADWDNVPQSVQGLKAEVDKKGFIDRQINGLTIMVCKEGTWKIE